MNPSDVYALLYVISSLNPRQQRAFFQYASREQISAFEEACLNLLKNPVGIKGSNLAWARSKKQTIKKLADRQVTKTAKRKILQQKGGFLAALIPVLASLVSSFIT